MDRELESAMPQIDAESFAAGLTQEGLYRIEFQSVLDAEKRGQRWVAFTALQPPPVAAIESRAAGSYILWHKCRNLRGMRTRLAQFPQALAKCQNYRLIFGRSLFHIGVRGRTYSLHICKLLVSTCFACCSEPRNRRGETRGKISCG